VQAEILKSEADNQGKPFGHISFTCPREEGIVTNNATLVRPPEDLTNAHSAYDGSGLAFTYQYALSILAIESPEIFIKLFPASRKDNPGREKFGASVDQVNELMSVSSRQATEDDATTGAQRGACTLRFHKQSLHSAWSQTK